LPVGGVGLRAVTASCPFALLSFERASEGARASDRAAGCSWGVSWGRGARVDVGLVWELGRAAIDDNAEAHGGGGKGGKGGRDIWRCVLVSTSFGHVGVGDCAAGVRRAPLR